MLIRHIGARRARGFLNGTYPGLVRGGVGTSLVLSLWWEGVAVRRAEQGLLAPKFRGSLWSR